MTIYDVHTYLNGWTKSAIPIFIENLREDITSAWSE